ncbi:DUF3106 domain-containing protein [Cognatilysobacter bugurensis]|uniref:DUF3106 domain-containing protein n=1 Tax=Cognatilysobacter bugurensis TaxID=543356 RepID=A0A918T0K4_9GAMM|nr:DUF3106 domain-containing protein [Lysobacter bugurensis]GHA82499.1 hypothetical protein GCM10007067_20590 [Lysobacter bugurensis]
MGSDRRRFGRAVGALLAVSLATAAIANAAPTLSSFKRVLPLLPPVERARLEQRVETLRRWSASERAAHAERVAAWEALPAATRAARRERYAAWQALPPDERALLTQARAAFGAIEPAQREALRARFDALDGTLHRGWRLGPTLGADYVRLQPLLAQVPEDEHAPLLRTLRAMTPLQRMDLAMLVQRTPPHERSGLRRELVSTSAAQRDAWLYARLQR